LPLSCSNAVLVSESHLAKSGVKQANAAPPTTPMEKYKLRISVGRLTGRLDLACMAVWPEDQSQSHAGTHSSLPTAAVSQEKAGTTDSAASAGAGDGAFLTQDGDETGEAKGPEEEGIFDQVADSRDGNAAEEAALAEASALQPAEAGGHDAAHKAKLKKAKEMMLDFRLSVVPKEVLKISGKTPFGHPGLFSADNLLLLFVLSLISLQS
jgi:hypothetical protein